MDALSKRELIKKISTYLDLTKKRNELLENQESISKSLRWNYDIINKTKNYCINRAIGLLFLFSLPFIVRFLELLFYDKWILNLLSLLFEAINNGLKYITKLIFSFDFRYTGYSDCFKIAIGLCAIYLAFILIGRIIYLLNVKARKALAVKREAAILKVQELRPQMDSVKKEIENIDNQLQDLKNAIPPINETYRYPFTAKTKPKFFDSKALTYIPEEIISYESVLKIIHTLLINKSANTFDEAKSKIREYLIEEHYKIQADNQKFMAKYYSKNTHASDSNNNNNNGGYDYAEDNNSYETTTRGWEVEQPQSTYVDNSNVPTYHNNWDSDTMVE